MTAKKKHTPNTQNDSWVVIAADSAFDTQGHDTTSDPGFVRLRNPSTDAASLYLFSSGDVQLYEVKAFQEEFHSWFIGQTVQRDGRLLYVTPVDPIYLILPYLMKAGNEERFQPMDQVVMDEEFPACSRLLGSKQCLVSLHHIAEEKDVGGLKFHRYSQEKTLEWLKKKVERTVKALRKSNVSVGEGVKSTTYIRVKEEAQDVDMLLQDSPRRARPRRTAQTVDQWCTCGHCVMMSSDIQCLCCKEVPQVRRRMRELDAGDRRQDTCMSEHPGLGQVCFNTYVLQAALQMYRAAHGPLRGNKELYKRYRYLAYRMFVAWCWGRLGKNIRVPIPACVVNHIRQHFPDDDGQYVGFRRRALN